MDWTATLRSVTHRAQRAPHFLGGCGGFDERQTGPRQSIVYRVHYGRDRAERAGLAHAFDAERVAVGQGRVVGELERAEIAGARHCVILERAGEQLAARLVVDEVLHQRLTDALDDPAVDLSLAEQRVQDPADIVDRDVAGQCDLAGLLVDLDLAAMRPAGECRATGRTEIGPLREAGLDIVRPMPSLERLLGD